MATYYTVTGNLGGFMPPGTNLASLVVVVTTNLGGPVVDTAGNRVALGDVDAPVQANGDISVSLLQTDSADTNVSGWSYWLNVGYRTSISKVDGRGATRDVARLGPFPLTADSTLAELSVHFDTPAVDPTWRDGFRTEMEQVRADAEAARDAAVDLSQIATPDALVGTLIETPGSDTAAALNNAIASAHGRSAPGATAAGVGALDVLTTGGHNTAFGYQALGAATTDIDSTAVGSRALAVQRGDGQNTAIGANAGRGVTTGAVNTFIGFDAGYRDVAASTAAAMTTGDENTIIGSWAGATSGDVYCATAIGNRTKVGDFSTAIGYGTKATHDGGVAIGTDTTGVSAETAAANFIALGTATHTIHIVGKLRIDRNQTTVGAAGGASAVPATPVKYASVWADDTEYVIPLYAKA